jgi:hypothetical protein
LEILDGAEAAGATAARVAERMAISLRTLQALEDAVRG